MEQKNPYLLLIENCLGKLSLKYNTPFKYEISKKEQENTHTFTIFQGDDPIYSKSVHYLENIDSINYVHYMIVRDFFVGGIERIFMQRENAKKLLPKDHSKMTDDQLKITTGNW
jgi:hypothetical protein